MPAAACAARWCGCGAGAAASRSQRSSGRRRAGTSGPHAAQLGCMGGAIACAWPGNWSGRLRPTMAPRWFGVLQAFVLARAGAAARQQEEWPCVCSTAAARLSLASRLLRGVLRTSRSGLRASSESAKSGTRRSPRRRHPAACCFLVLHSGTPPSPPHTLAFTQRSSCVQSARPTAGGSCLRADSCRAPTTRPSACGDFAVTLAHGVRIPAARARRFPAAALPAAG